MPSGDFWFCLRHHVVESGAVESGAVCAPADRLGRYPTAEDARRALEKVQERNEAWDNDPDWNDRGPGSGPVG
jgi:hypothetical protein